MTAILDWLKHTVTLFGLSAPAWAFCALGAGLVVENILGRLKTPWARSTVALVAKGLSALLKITRVGAIPVVGPMVVRLLETIAGVDLDGDGSVGDAPKAASAVLLLVALNATACATTGGPDGGTIVSDVIDCSVKSVEDVARSLLDEVASDLIAYDWEARLLKLAETAGVEAVTCAVQEIGSQSHHNAMASGDALEASKADRAIQWLSKHPVKQ